MRNLRLFRRESRDRLSLKSVKGCEVSIILIVQRHHSKARIFIADLASEEIKCLNHRLYWIQIEP